MPVFELRDRLKIHYRCQPWSTPEQKRGAVTMVQLLTSSSNYGGAYDWRDLIKKDEQEDMKELLEKQPPAMTKDTTYQLLLPPQALYFDRSIDKLMRMYPESRLDTGLSSAAIASLHQHYGYNQLPDPPKPSAIKMLWAQLTDFMVLILLVAAVVEAAERDFNSMSVLIAVIVLNTIIGFSQEWKASKTLNALMNLAVPKARVMRDGKQDLIASQDLVPGDVVVLEEGDAVPADLRLVDVSQLQVVESILTGESLPVMKSTSAIKARTRRIPIGDCKGNAFMSTTVARGRAVGIVVRIGQDTEIGRISAAIQQGSLHKSKTPIQKKLGRLGKQLVLLSIVLCLLVVAIGLAWKKDIKHMLNVGLSLAVSVIPEGLVAVTTVTMALGVRRMAANHCIVRTLPAVESLGSVTVICSDKTGTLTEGKMGVSELWTGDDVLYKFTDSTSLDPEKGDILHSNVSLLASAHSSSSTLVNSSLEKDKTPFTNESTNTLATETTIVCCSSPPPPPGYQRLHEQAFDSERKLMSVVYQHGDEHIMLCKGAPEELLRKCTYYYDASSQQLVPLQDDSSFSKRVSQESSRMASRGLRVLGLARKSCCPVDENHDSTDEHELTFIGLIGLIDPPKQGVKEAIQTCQEAGIHVMMITGDHVKTATAIATQLGIFDPDHLDKNRAILGQELDLLSQDAIIALDPFPCVFARVSPDNKLKIVQALQQRGELVAMTGDGVNDAPAIKCADVGVAMGGEAGTEITKQAADLVLLDDNFSTIIEAVEEGRHVFDNILKFIVYLLSCNGAEIFLMLMCAIANLETPLTVMMILYANIIADIPPAMALGVEPAEVGLMKRKPRNPNQGVLTRVTWLIIFVQSMLIAVLTVAVYVVSLQCFHYSIASAQSLASAFATLTTLQLLHSFLSRSILQSVFVAGVFGNRWMVVAFIVSFSCLLIGIYAPGISSWLGLSFVDGFSWCMILVCCMVQITVIEIEKLIIKACHGRI
ncbi:hypothetical protein FB192DRAFT_1270721 [Mucor lusitanicus]|uniref:Cation-transporting P-type ATPase N-terminal domain-containing protein n=1 Tax=Mucor circinelloides f. lusitanicus TaxID=29924 RepID=A0A8H4BUI6_MUCCL|nr:hypothetical protein FB192DRAFT_1270721 [Mucor lusitanicus]